ncbi:hypothetical protein CVT26_015390, partial [Gymnopilus dilepis]
MSAFSFESQHSAATIDIEHNPHDMIDSIAEHDLAEHHHAESTDELDINTDEDLAEALAVMHLLVPDFDDSDMIHLTGDALEVIDDGVLWDQNGPFTGSWDVSMNLEVLSNIGVEAGTFQYSFDMFYSPEEMAEES